jgi:hypothetical protein
MCEAAGEPGGGEYFSESSGGLDGDGDTGADDMGASAGDRGLELALTASIR